MSDGTLIYDDANIIYQVVDDELRTETSGITAVTAFENDTVLQEGCDLVTTYNFCCSELHC